MRIGHVGRRTAAAGLLCGPLLLASCFGLFSSPRPKVKPQQWDASRGPVVPHDSFPTDCSLCHQGKDWHDIRADFTFDHAKSTGVALNGAHAAAECLRCHNDRGAVAQFSKRGCGGCHEDIHRGALDRTCVSCHSETTWVPGGVYAMHAQTRFPLSGAHAAVACFRCHKDAQVGDFRNASPRCEACHQDQLARATDPNHALLGLITDCQRCHRPVAWQGAQFNHAGIASGCARCHQAEYNATTNPNHAAAGYPTSCESCHNTSSWRGGGPLNHTFDIRNGPHRVFSCVECHRVPANYAVVSCVHCHTHNKTTSDDKHKDVSGYSWTSVACIGCHPTGR
jgi:hypothetical protein